MLGVTLTPTKAEAGKKANVIPSAAEALIDCRVPPGYGEDEARRQLVGPDRGRRLQIEFSEAVVGNRSPMASPLADAIGAWLAEADPGAELAPDRDAGLQRQPLVPRLPSPTPSSTASAPTARSA